MAAYTRSSNIVVRRSFTGRALSKPYIMYLAGGMELNNNTGLG